MSYSITLKKVVYSFLIDIFLSLASKKILRKIFVTSKTKWIVRDVLDGACWFYSKVFLDFFSVFLNYLENCGETQKIIPPVPIT